MTKRKLWIFCLLLSFLLLTGCMYDPFSGERPFDYGEGVWTCKTEDYEIGFEVDFEREDYYYPEGILQRNDEMFLCKFYFVHQTNRLLLSVYPMEYKDVSDELRDRNDMVMELAGDCDFSEDSLVVHIEKETDTVFGGTVDTLTFLHIK